MDVVVVGVAYGEVVDGGGVSGGLDGDDVEVKICIGCQERYSKDQFPENVKFKRGGVWRE